MFLAVEWGTGQVLWSMIYFFLLFIWFWLIISIFADIIRSKDLSGWAKAIWAVVIIFLPFLGIFVYLIVRGGTMADRAADQAQANEEAYRSYIRETASGSTGSADELAKLADLHNSGKLDDAEYASAKAKVLGS